MTPETSQRFLAISLSLLSSLPAFAQGEPDLEFRFPNPVPAFTADAESRPTVCFDAAHRNYHSPTNALRPLVELVHQDGYRSEVVSDAFSEVVLGGCDALVVATPVHMSNEDNWSFPHPSAFTGDEIRALYHWIDHGGGLFLILDHSPIPGAAADLLAVLGVAAFDGEARQDPAAPLPDVFTRADATLLDHPITLGGNESERVSRFATWTGSAFRTSREYDPLLIYGPRSRSWAELSETLPELPRREYPVFEIEGWLLAASRRLGNGRVIVLAEVAACTATTGPAGLRGMNTEVGSENARFCLNAIRWLTGVLDRREGAQSVLPAEQLRGAKPDTEVERRGGERP